MEPTIYKNYTNIIKIAKDYKVPFVALISNGQLINKSHLSDFIEYGLDELTISTHGVKLSTYERLMQGASYQKFIELLGEIDEIKRENNTKKPSLRINYTITPDNLAELKDFFDIFGKFKIDTIQLRPVFSWSFNAINTKYQDHDLNPFIVEYNETISQFIINCKERKISLFYNLIDPTYSKVNTFAPVYNEGIIRLINPRKVWLEEFDWKMNRTTNLNVELVSAKRCWSTQLEKERLSIRKAFLDYRTYYKYRLRKREGCPIRVGLARRP